MRHRDFRIFWIGLLLSSIGSQFTTVAMAWQIYELTNSPLQIGLIGLARAVPQMVILLYGGLLADAMNRRRLMMVTQSSLFLVSGTLALMTLAGRTTPLTLYVVVIFLALFSSLEAPSRQALVSNLVPPEDLSRALAIFSAQRHVAVIAGPSAAGVILGLSGPALCYLADALSWLIMFLSLSRIRAQLPERGGWRGISLSALREGFNFVLGHAVIFPLLVMDFGANIFGSVRALLPVFARDVLMVGPQGLGVLYAASAAGSLLGAASLGLIGQIRRAGAWILIGVTIYGLSIVLFAQSQLFWLSVFLLACSGFGDTISAVLRATINQLSTSDELRGRMASINSIFTNSGPQLGQFEAGLVASFLGAELSAITGGVIILSIVSVLGVGFPHVRRFEIRDRSVE